MKKLSKISALITQHASRFLSNRSAGEILAEIIRVRLLHITPRMIVQVQTFKAVDASNVGVIFFSRTPVAA